MAAAVDPVRIDLRVGPGELFAGAVKEQTTTNAGAFPFDFAQGQDFGSGLLLRSRPLNSSSYQRAPARHWWQLRAPSWFTDTPRP